MNCGYTRSCAVLTFSHSIVELKDVRFLSDSTSASRIEDLFQRELDFLLVITRTSAVFGLIIRLSERLILALIVFSFLRIFLISTTFHLYGQSCDDNTWLYFVVRCSMLIASLRRVSSLYRSE
jgi:hypothetical protein